MSWFDWLKSKPAAHSGDSGHTMDLSAGDHLNDAAFRSPGNDVDFKAQRQTRRENLYAVVREAMIRSEVLASRYKFKVLSLDTHGRQFLVMVDLMDATALPAHRFLAVEQLIVSHAAQQHGLFVKSVYWRSNEAYSSLATKTTWESTYATYSWESRRTHTIVQDTTRTVVSDIEAKRSSSAQTTSSKKSSN